MEVYDKSYAALGWQLWEVFDVSHKDHMSLQMVIPKIYQKESLTVLINTYASLFS